MVELRMPEAEVSLRLAIHLVATARVYIEPMEFPDFRGESMMEILQGETAMSTKPSTGRVRQVYEFIEQHRNEYSVQAMCGVIGVAPSGYYEWLQRPISDRALEDARLLRLVRKSFVASHGIYGAPRAFLDPREAGETCSKHRVARLMRENSIRALHGYRTRRIAAVKNDPFQYPICCNGSSR